MNTSHSHLRDLSQRETNRDDARVDVDGLEVGQEGFDLTIKRGTFSVREDIYINI